MIYNRESGAKQNYLGTTFKYDKTDRRSRRLTTVWLLLVGAIIFLMWYLWGEGGYAIAWVVSLVMAFIMLCVLSIPRNIEVGDTALEIRCIVELTRIPLSDIKALRVVSYDEMRRFLPLFAGYGFFGYYGYYLDIRTWETVKLYCTRWDNFVEVTDIFEKRYYINCSEPGRLMDAVTTASQLYAGEGEG